MVANTPVLGEALPSSSLPFTLGAEVTLVPFA